MSSIKNFFVSVLGCKVNQYDARQIEQLLECYGLCKVMSAAQADLIVVHTCGVTGAAAQKSRQTIRRMQHEEALVVVTGCAAIDALTQVDQSPAFRVPAGKGWLENLAEQLDQLDLPHSGIAKNLETDAFPVTHFGDHTRAFLKVQDGCDIGCSFCIVPQLRKEPRDKTIEVAVQEAMQLTEKGYREIVVTGVSVGLYGRNKGYALVDLLRELVAIPNMGRIRLSSLHPGELTDDLLNLWASSPCIMPHLHLSLQSGSDSILKSMRRGYTSGEYFDAVLRARAVLDNPAFTTDVIVGFPGETDLFFEESYAFCEKVGFSQMHVFSYSARPQTVAAKMSHQVNGRIASERSVRLRQLAQTMAKEYHRQFLGQSVDVLIEQVEKGQATGYSKHYIPVTILSDQLNKNQQVQITVNQVGVAGVLGDLRCK